MPLFVVDDDPTGVQGQEDVPLLLAWGPRLIDAALRTRPRAIHVMTNSRALDETGAYDTVRDAVATVRAASGNARLILRGDSTLRGHLEPEYRATVDGLELAGSPPLLRVPALPAAGRVTIDGLHWLVRHGTRVPIGETEFAADATFGYRSSRLLDWADERSGGAFAAEAGAELHLEALRGPGGADAVADALLTAAAIGAPSVVAPDAETDHDLQIITEGLRRAWRREPGIVVRCSPAFASALSGAGATGPAPLPRVERGLLVVVGSHVAMSSAQLAVLAARHPGSLVEVDAAALTGPHAEAALELPGVESSEDIAQVIVRRGAILERTEATQQRQFLDAEKSDLGEALGAGQHGEQTQKQHLIERIAHLALLARILEVLEMTQENNRFGEGRTVRRHVVHHNPRPANRGLS